MRRGTCCLHGAARAEPRPSPPRHQDTKNIVVSWCLGVFVALSACGGDDTSPVRGVRGLVDRTLPEHSSAIELEHIGSADGLDGFELETRDDKLVVRGSSEVALASGLRHYLEYYANAHVSWGGARLDLAAALPAVPERVRRETSHAVRYAYNFTVFGYSTPHWDWPRWEREIDLLAMHGFNLALVTIGYEADSPDKLELLTERPLSDPPRSGPHGSCSRTPPRPRRENGPPAGVNRPTPPRTRAVRDWLGRSGAPPVRRGSLEGGLRRWVVSRTSGRRRRARDRLDRARPGATRACALPRAAADRRATRGASWEAGA